MPDPTMTEAAIEAAARALCRAWMDQVDEGDPYPYWRSFATSLEDAVEKEWRNWLDPARVAIAAYLAAQPEKDANGLLPCPFCGLPPQHNDAFAWCCGSSDDLHRLMQESLTRWNIRPGNLQCRAAPPADDLRREVEVVFDGPPGPQAGRFIEVEVACRSIKLGQWMQRDDGYWVLRFTLADIRTALAGKATEDGGNG